jgi:hypothetical protein
LVGRGKLAAGQLPIVDKSGRKLRHKKHLLKDTFLQHEKLPF